MRRPRCGAARGGALLRHGRHFTRPCHVLLVAVFILLLKSSGGTADAAIPVPGVRVPTREMSMFDNVLKKENNVVERDLENSKERRPTNLGYIKNANTIDISKRPWTVLVWAKSIEVTVSLESPVISQDLGENAAHACTGSLIGKRYVLLAAHCVDWVKYPSQGVFVKSSRLGLFVGQNSSNANSAGIDFVPKENVNLFYHNQYRKFIEYEKQFDANNLTCMTELPMPFMPDIAILKLDRSALDEPGGDKAAEIPLPEGPELDSGYFYGKECVASGAGFTENFETGTLRDYSLDLSNPLENLAKWKEIITMNNQYWFNDLNISDDDYLKREISKCDKIQYWVATGETDPKVFAGDSGGPLACKGEGGRFVLAGVHHGGFPKDLARDAPVQNKLFAQFLGTIHYRTAPYVQWIKSVMADDGEDVENVKENDGDDESGSSARDSTSVIADDGKKVNKVKKKEGEDDDDDESGSSAPRPGASAKRAPANRAPAHRAPAMACALALFPHLRGML